MALGETTQVDTEVPETIVTPMVEATQVTTVVPKTTRVVLVVAVETSSDSAIGQTSSRWGR